MAARFAFATFMALAAALFLSLGVWQLERLSWKRDLIARTEAKLAAAPIHAPDPSQWPNLTESDAYTRVHLSGTYDDTRTTLVRASTRLGRGFWMLTPLTTDTGQEPGFTVFINRGFVTDAQAAAPHPHRTSAAPLPLTGLLRLSEPQGTMLQANNPSQDKWFSRDIPAIAASHRILAAPYFIDLDADPTISFPVSGLTVIQFRNHHLQYALTWFALMGLCLFGAFLILRKNKPNLQNND